MCGDKKLEPGSETLTMFKADLMGGVNVVDAEQRRIGAFPSE